MPEALVGGDDERGLVVVVERAQADQVLAVALQLDAAGAHQRGQVGLAFQPVELVVWDSGHVSLLGKTCQEAI